jgi:hypothetical protein
MNMAIGYIKRNLIRDMYNSRNMTKMVKEEDASRAKKKKGNIIYLSDYKNCETPFQKRVYSKETIEEIKKFCKDKTSDEILEAMGIKVSHDLDGSKTISHYAWPNEAYSFQAAGIDESKLLKGVKRIKDYCDLSASNLKNLGEVESIGGALFIPIFTKLEDLSSVKSVGAVDCNGEKAEDITELFEKINFKPEKIGQAIGYKYPCGMISKTTTEALKKLGAEITYK